MRSHPSPQPALYGKRPAARQSSGAPRRSPWRGAALLAAVALVAALAGCSSSSTTGGATTGGATATTAATPTNTATPAATSTAITGSGPYPVKVYFSRHPDSDNDINKVFAVSRSSPTLMVATFSIQQLIAGPTASEKAAGYYTELSGSLSGASNCGGADFVITLNHRGPTPQTGTATLKFCRTVSLAGDLTGGRITAQVDAILTQFPSTQQVVILTDTGSCFNDLRGGNLCLQ